MPASVCLVPGWICKFYPERRGRKYVFIKGLGNKQGREGSKQNQKRRREGKEMSHQTRYHSAPRRVKPSTPPCRHEYSSLLLIQVPIKASLALCSLMETTFHSLRSTFIITFPIMIIICLRKEKNFRFIQSWKQTTINTLPRVYFLLVPIELLT